jgi:MFS family permease
MRQAQLADRVVGAGGLAFLLRPYRGEDHVRDRRVPGKVLVGTGLSLQAAALGWMALVSTPTIAYSSLVVPFILAGVGMALFFAPMANIVLSAVRPEEEGQASGANNAIRELGGVFGVAVLASVFASFGGYESGQAFSDGMNPALFIGAVVVGLGALAAFAIPGRGRQAEAPVGEALLEAA